MLKKQLEVDKETAWDDLRADEIVSGKSKIFGELFFPSLVVWFGVVLYFFVGRDYLIGIEKYLGDLKHIFDPIMGLTFFTSLFTWALFRPEFNFSRRNKSGGNKLHIGVRKQ